MGNHSSLVFSGIITPVFLGGAGIRPSTTLTSNTGQNAEASACRSTRSRQTKPKAKMRGDRRCVGRRGWHVALALANGFFSDAAHLLVLWTRLELVRSPCTGLKVWTESGRKPNANHDQIIRSSRRLEGVASMAEVVPTRQ